MQEEHNHMPKPPKPIIKPERALDSWKYRRTTIFLTLSFCACAIGYLVGFGEDTKLNETIANGLILLASSVILYYVAGSSYEDVRNKNY